MKIAYILGAFPVLTQSWVPEEIRGLLRLGEEVSVAALGEGSPPVDPAAWEDLAGRRWLLPARTLRARLGALGHHPLWLVRAPIGYLRTLFFTLCRPDLQALALFFSAPRVASWARREGAEWIHVHFADQGTEMALLVSRLTGIPFSFTPHAHDLWQGPRLLEAKVRRAAFVAAVSTYHQRWLRESFPGLGEERVPIVRYGIDTERIRPRRVGQAPGADGASPPFRVLSIGRLVPKKGHDLLVAAAGRLAAAGRRLEVRIVGEGPERPRLERLIGGAGPAGCPVRLLGALQRQEALAELAAADLFALACRRAPSGDMDGVPNSLMEAMALGLAVLTTRLSGIPDLVEDGRHGRLVEPEDAAGLAAALEELMDLPPAAREAMGRAGRERVEALYNRDREAAVLRDLFHQFRRAAQARHAADE